MLRTPLRDLLGIDVPIILAPMGTCTSAEFAAAVCNEGGLGGIGSLFRPTAAVKRERRPPIVEPGNSQKISHASRV